MARCKCVPSAQLKAVNTDRLIVKSQHHMSAQLACLSRKHMLQLSLGSRARALSWPFASSFAAAGPASELGHRPVRPR